MRDEYQRRYGIEAEVLYPIRATDFHGFDAPPERVGRNDGPFTIAFAGSINSDGYIRALLDLQRAVQHVTGRLLIFGPLAEDAARQLGLNSPHTVVRGLVNATELMKRLREEADALFVPMSFDPADRSNMELAFPSKLADCTAVGLPLLIYGPPYSSVMNWARANAGVGELVATDQGGDLIQAVQRLANDPERRVELATRALEVGRQYFSHAAVQSVFHRALICGQVAAQ
jgi:glycosyltransferase involved in cell wall biosynthesis